jgi:hypothetical protein
MREAHRAALAWVWGLLIGFAGVASAAAQGSGTLWAEASVSKEAPSVQESVVYTVRVYSPGNLQTVELTPPVPSGASLEELERGTATTRVIRGRGYVVNEYHYLLTVLAPGSLEVPAARLNVQAGADPRMGGAPAWGNRRTALATNPVRLSVRALPAGAALPLRLLDVQAHWGQAGAQGVGEPLTLTVVTKGLGVTGSRLPSVAPQLRGEGFKVYPERPQVDWKWGTGGSGGEVWGRRVETFTVVPTREGMLDFPPVEVAWWDVQGNREAHARVPGRTIPVGSDALARAAAGGGAAAPSFMRRLLTREALVNFVLPVGGGLALAFLLGWWLGVGGLPRLEPASEGADRTAARGAPAVGSPARALWRAFSEYLAGLGRRMPTERIRALWAPVQPALASVSQVLAGLVPLRLKAWWCVRCAVRETHPEGLCRVVRRFACQHLQMSPNAPLATIVDRIRQERPGAAQTDLERVLRDLEDAAYAGRALDLRSWKREFRRRFRRAFAAREKARSERPRRGLPELNP